MSSVPPLLSAPGAGKPSRSASGVVAKPTRGFEVFRIDGYSWTKTLPGGERITSEIFTIGGHRWCVDYYPNGTDGGKDDESDAVSLYLRMVAPGGNRQRVRAEYKFSLLDLAGTAAYELPVETAVFSARATPADIRGYGYAGFITKVELERRRDSLLGDDRIAIRCDVGVTEVTAAMTVFVGPTNGRPQSMIGGYGGGRGRGMPHNYDYGYYPDGAEYEFPDDDDEDDGGSHKGKRREPDDKEYIRRCLSSQHRK